MKTKLDYLSELEGELKFLKKKDRNDFIRYYRQKIDTELDYGIPEEKVIKNLPNPRAVAIKIYHDKGIDYLKLQKSKLKISTVIFTALSLLLIVGTIYIGVNLLITLVKMFVNMVTLYVPFFKLPLVDLILSTIFLTIYLILVILFIIILLESILLVIRLILHKLFNAYPALPEVDLEPYSILYWINKLFKKEQVIFKTFGILALLLVGIGVLGFFNKTYIYRVLKNTPLNEELFLLEEVSLNNLSIDVSNLETGLVILPGDNDKITIKYQYEFDHDLSIELRDNILYFRTKDPKHYDLFNLLKEPLQYIYIMVPATTTIEGVNLKITYGEILLENIRLNELNVEMLSGKLATQNTTIDKATINVNKINYQSKSNIITDLSLKMQVGVYQSTDDIFTTYLIDNTFTDGNIKNINAEILTINNQSGNFNFESVITQNLNINTSSGAFTIEKYTVDQFNYKGTGLGNLRLIDGKHEKATIDMRDGLIYTIETDGDIMITGYELNTNSVNQRSGNLEVNQELGSISIINDLDKPNHISTFKCAASDINLTITATYIEEMDVDLGKAIVLIEEVYGKIVQIKVKSGDLNYHNNNLDYEFESFNAFIQLGTKNVNIENTKE